MKNWTNYLYVVTILFFSLGFFNIIFAWLGLICMLMPFVLLYKDKKKTWCNTYCPRGNLFSVVCRNRSLTGKAGPAWLIRGNAKWVMLGYFAINLFVLTMSTIMVFKGVREPLELIRFMMAFRLPWEIPQLLEIAGVQDWVIHLSFRIYSMMFTTTILGLVLGWLYKPRTWCTICPINTLSDLALNKIRLDDSKNKVST